MRPNNCSSLCHKDEPCMLTEDGHCDADKQADIDDDEPTCPRCGGPIYSQPHWSYWQCDDCGYSEKKQEMEP